MKLTLILNPIEYRWDLLDEIPADIQSFARMLLGKANDARKDLFETAHEASYGFPVNEVDVEGPLDILLEPTHSRCRILSPQVDALEFVADLIIGLVETKQDAQEFLSTPGLDGRADEFSRLRIVASEKFVDLSH